MRFLPLEKYAKILKYISTNFIRKEAIYPFYASFKITHKCNFRCKFCNVWKENVPDVPKEDVKKVLDNIGESSILLLSFEGGEPLLREDIGELLKYAHTKPFYILFTTSERKLESYPMDDYGKYIDFLHISIDEGHHNISLYDRLENFKSWGDYVLAVQIVVSKDDLSKLEKKIEKCYQAGAKAVVMPAVHLPNTDNYLPNIEKFRDITLALKEKYPNTITTPYTYLKNITNLHACSASSIIIDSDCGLFYPCRTLGKKPINLLRQKLNDFLLTKTAEECREEMRNCNKHCLWYQYFATDSYTSLGEVISALRPHLSWILRGRKASC
ncbi:MAG: radical SAM protein [Candidatus Thermoplasmatota archaeon]